MLATVVQFQLQTVPLLAQIPSHRDVTVRPLRGARHPFLLVAGVVEGRDITVQGRQIIVQGREPCMASSQEIQGCHLHLRQIARGMAGPALAEDTFGRNLIEAQRSGDVGVLSDPIDRLEVVLAQTQLRHVAGKDVGMHHGIDAQGRHRLGIRAGCCVHSVPVQLVQAPHGR